MPIFERYFVGGIYDVRGFPPRSLGPVIRALTDRSQDSSLRNFLVGGNMQVIMNAEIEFPIFDKVGIRGVVFIDMGNAFNLEDQYCTIRPSVVDDSKNPCLEPPRLLRLSPELGLRVPLVLAHRSPALRVGHPVQDPARRAADRLRVHNRQLFLIRVKQPALPEEMTMSRVTQFLVAAVFLLSTSAAFAEDAKLGYVDMQRALNETEDGRKAKEKLKKDFDQKQKELDEQQTQLKKDIEDLDKKRTLLPADKVREKEVGAAVAAGEGAADLRAPPAGSAGQGAEGDRARSSSG